mgnify:CR=1 FL=1
MNLLKKADIPMQWMMFLVRYYRRNETFYLTTYHSEYKRIAYTEVQWVFLTGMSSLQIGSYLSQQVFLSSSVIARITLHGFPTATELFGISFITTLPPPITTLSPMVTPGIT